MRIVIDLQGAQTESRYRGIGRYSLSLTKYIIRNRGDHEIIVALSAMNPETIEPIRAEFDGLLPQENIRVWHAPQPVFEFNPNNTWRRKVAELLREAFLASLEPDIIHIMSMFEGFHCNAVTSIGRFDKTTPVSTSFFDLIPLLNPEHYLKPNPAYEQHYLQNFEYLKRSSLLLAISESSRKEGLKFLEFSGDKIVNTSVAVDNRFRPIKLNEQDKRLLENKSGITRPFVLYSGGADERKNLPRLIQAYANISPELRNTHQLVFSGRIPEGIILDLQDKAKTEGLNADELIFSGYVTDDELVRLYNLCKLFIFPSWHEGFGLPALEAMSCGAAVIGANTSSVPEVIDNPSALFDPLSLESISEKLTELLTNDSLRAKLSIHGIEQSKKFSWDRSARIALSAFEKIGVHRAHNNSNLLTELIDSIASIDIETSSDLDILHTAESISKNHPQKSKKQLLVDISELITKDSKTGVQRVTRSILNALISNPPSGYSVEAVYATFDSAGYRYAKKYMFEQFNIQTATQDEYIEYQPGDIFIGLDLQHHMVLTQKKFLSELYQCGVKVVFILHDLLPINFPNYFPSEHNVDAVHSEWIKTIACFDGIVCVSRTVANELADWLHINGPKRLRPFHIGWSHNGSDIQNSVPSFGLPDDAELTLRQLSNRPTFLMVGTLEPRKGHAQTLDVFDQLWREGFDVNLVIVGKEGWMVEELISRLKNHNESTKRLFWLDGISDEFLEKVYSISSCLIAASEGEGFGLPLIEAAQHKLPIIARDIPVFREVAGEHASYFSGHDTETLSNSIKKWLTLNAEGKSPQSDKMPWLKWKQSADRLMEIILQNDWYLRMDKNWQYKQDKRPVTQCQ